MDQEATEYVISERDFQLKRIEEIRTALAEARETGNWSKVPPQVFKQYLDRIILSSSSTLANKQIESEIDVISAECIFSVQLPDANQPLKNQAIIEQDFQNARNNCVPRPCAVLLMRSLVSICAIRWSTLARIHGGFCLSRLEQR